jgi:transposase
MTADEAVTGGNQFGTNRYGYAAMLLHGTQWPDRVCAIEGGAGMGKHISNRLLADGEQGVELLPNLSA